ncbi:MAG: DUF2917 domain-containing protein [Burkholderiales bacterium]|nr:DUF2917 domain-containing protein [Burkholderiales bacterium]
MNLAVTLPRLLPWVWPAWVTRTPKAPVLHRLRPDAFMTLADRRLQLRVLRGCVWITRDGCPADLVLGAGDVFEQHPGAPVLVQALDDAELSIAPGG